MVDPQRDRKEGTYEFNRPRLTGVLVQAVPVHEVVRQALSDDAPDLMPATLQVYA